MTAKQSVENKTPNSPALDATLLDWALWHQDRGEEIGGYWLTPLRPGEKMPYQTGWSKNPLKTREAVEQHWSSNPSDNIGLIPRPGHFWLDADNLDVLEVLEGKHGRLPAVYSQRSINGNLHFLFRGDVPNSPTVHYEGERLGEIRGALSGQCVGAGSRGMTRDGKPGVWEINELAPPMIAPDWLFGLIKTSGKATLGDKRQDYGQTTDWDFEQAKRLVDIVMRGKRIKDYEGAFVEGERDNLTFQTFAEAKNRMIHPDAMLEAILDVGLDGGLDSVEQKMQSAYYTGNTQGIYGEKVNAYWVPNYLFKVHVDGKEVDRPPADPVEWKAANPDKLPNAFPGDPTPNTTSALTKRDALSFYYLDELDAIPEPTWVIGGILPEGGYTLAYGKRSTMKSFAVLDMGLSLATGTAYHGKAVKQGRIVYFAGEGFQGTNNRIKAWFKMHKLSRANYARDFVLVPFTSKWDTAAGRDLVRQHLSAIAKDGPISIVIIDTARRAMSGDENAPTSVGQFLDGVNAICREFSCGSLIVHHAGKDAGKGARGGSNFEDDADAVLRFTKGTGGMVHMKCTKQKDSESDWTMKFRAESITLGSKPDGKPITSLALVLDGESMADDGEATPAKGDVYEIQDAMAVRILDAMEDPSADRGKLSIAVMGEMSPEMRETDPNAFNKCLRAYKMHLTRLSPKSPLWQYVHEKNAKGQALTFRNPEHKGRRASKPGQHKTLNYTLPNEEEG